MLLGNINGKKLVRFYIITSIVTAVLSIISYIILGSFYIANNHTILVNIIVWSLTILIAYCLYYFPYFFIMRYATKTKEYGPLLNGYAIASGFLAILLLCLANSYTLGDYSYVEIMGFMAGIVVIPQIAISVAGYIKNKK